MNIEVQADVYETGVLSFPCEGYSIEEFEQLPASEREDIIYRNANMTRSQVNDFWLIKKKKES